MTIRQRATRDDQKVERREAILKAALALFRESRYEDVTMAALAERLGLVKGTVYLYFKTKEALFLALAEAQLHGWCDAVDAALDERSWQVGELSAMIAESLRQRPMLARLLAILATVLESNIEYETARDFKRGLLSRLLGTGTRLERRLRFLKAGDGARVLLRLHAVAVGLQHLAEPAPVIVKALAHNPELAPFHIDFSAELEAMFEALLLGMQRKGAAS